MIMKLERMIAIIMLLLQREKMGGKELAELFEVSLRTIYRDIETINQAGIPIVTSSGDLQTKVEVIRTALEHCTYCLLCT